MKSLLIFITFICCSGSRALAQDVQRYNCYSYTINNGLLQNNILDMQFDKNNTCWISFANGIQQFNGRDFIQVPVQPGLPDDKWVHFYKDSKNNLYISHSHGISLFNPSNSSFTQVYQAPAKEKYAVTFIGEENAVLYFYTVEGNITGMDTRNYRIVSDTCSGLVPAPNLPGVPVAVSSSIAGHKTVILVNRQLQMWDLQQQKPVYKPLPFSGSHFFLMATKGSKALVTAATGHSAGIYEADFVKGTLTGLYSRKPDGEKVFRAEVFQWGSKSLYSHFNHIYELDSSLTKEKGELLTYDNEPLAGNAVICNIREDRFGNLYVITITDGFRKIIKKKFPLKYYGTVKKDSNYVLSVFPDKIHNRVLAGTYGNGLLVFDSSQHLVKHIPSLPGRSNRFSPVVIAGDNGGGYLLFVWSEKILWKLDASLTKFSPVPINGETAHNEVGYFSTLLSQDNGKTIIQSQNTVYRYTAGSATASSRGFEHISPMSAIIYRGQLVTHSHDELEFFDTSDYKLQKKIPFPNTGEVRCFAADAVGDLYLGCNKGIFKIDATGKILAHLDKKSGLPDECIYAMAWDSDSMLWCSTNRGILRINKRYEVFQLKRDDGLQENEFNTNAVARASDGELFFAGTNGITSFFPGLINTAPDPLQIAFTSISFNNQELFPDSTLASLTEIRAPYNQNAFSFDFIAVGPQNPDQYVYQYKMDGIDHEWIKTRDLKTIHYLLQPGHYTFNVYAGPHFDEAAIPLRQISIDISPPLWKKWWFRLLASFAGIWLIAWIINLYNNSRYQRKLAELESEHKIQMERQRISRDLHDNIGAYANAVIYNTELLQKEKNDAERDELMKDLRFASKDIITSLRETIWALKKDTYSAQDCLLRIRNFVQPFGGYCSHIRFSVTGDAPAGRMLHSTEALNLVRIVQEAVANGIKHSGATSIAVQSSVVRNEWTISVSDNGHGFDYAVSDELQGGNGLANMKQRAAESGFRFRITASQGEGTTVLITL